MRPASHPAPRVPVGAVVAAVLGTALVGATLLRQAAELVDRSAVTADVDLIPGWLRAVTAVASVGCVAAMWRGTSRPHVGAGFAILLTGWQIPEWADFPPLTYQLRLAAAFVWPLITAGIAIIVLLWRRPTSRQRRCLLLLILGLSAAAAIVGALGYNPFDDPRCSTMCRDVPAPLDGVLTSPQALNVAGILALGSCALLFIGVVQVRPRYLGVAAAVANASLVFLSLREVSGRAGFIAASRTGIALGAGAVGAAVLWALLRTSQTRRAVEVLVADLTAGTSVACVQFAARGRPGWIDSEGRPVDETPDDGRWVILEDREGPAIRIAVANGAGERTALERMSGATLLALENVRLAAVGRAGLREVQESQQRIVATFDDERRRIERDLHDGAQQRLVSVAFQLSAARTRVGGSELADAEASVREALEALRDLTHGVFPSALVDEGIAAALEDLIAASGVSVTLDSDLDAGLDWQAATATYAVVAYVLTCGRSSVSIRVRNSASVIRLRARIHSPATPDNDLALGEVRDRVGAIGGTLDVSPCGPHMVHIDAVIPCVSS